jgi:hypothetical protein
MRPDGKFNKRKNEYTTGVGQKLSAVHSVGPACSERCVIHNPSKHSMRKFKTHWRAAYEPFGLRSFGYMERICPHGVGHPDPDAMYFELSMGTNPTNFTHGCCGCCSGEIHA